MANIQNELNNIKNATFGKEVRGSIHDGIDAINKEVESTTGRQVDLESTFDQLVINAGNSNAEIVDARVKADGTSYSKLGDRLDSVDSQLEHNTSLLRKEEARPFRGYGVYFNSFNDNDLSIIKKQIEDCIEIGCESLCLYCDGDIDATYGTYEANIDVKIEYWNKLLNNFNNKQFKNSILRLGVTNKQIIDVNNYFNGLKSRIAHIIDNLEYSFDIVVIANENDLATTNREYIDKWLDLIHFIKINYNKKVTMSPTLNELHNIPEEILNELDFIGVNFYPSISHSVDLNICDYEDMKKYVSFQLEQLFPFHYKYKKKIIILECGCHSGQYGYLSPGTWQSINYDYHENALIWWKIVLELLESCNLLYEYTIFYTPASYDLLKSYFYKFFNGGI